VWRVGSGEGAVDNDDRLEEDAVAGIVSIGDLVNWVINEQQQTIRHLEAYITGVAA
jgi:hypothetical protein